jgi:hypothetical protein
MLIFKSYFNFLVNPKRNYTSTKSKKQILTFLTVLLITYILLFIISFIPTVQITSDASRILNLIASDNPVVFLLIPLYEELMFRLPLKVSKSNIAISAGLFISSVLLVLANVVFNAQLSLLHFYLLSFTGAIPFFFLIKSLYGQSTETFFTKNYNYLFYISLILFAALHFYSQDFSLPALLTYLVYGYSLSFLRVSTNFLNSLILHFIFIAPFLFKLF